MQAPTIAQDQDVYHVGAWKRGIDKSSHRLRQLFFDWAYMPFVRWSFKWMKIPCPAGAEVTAKPDGTTVTTFLWYEDQGIFADAGSAEAACLEPTWGYKPMPFGKLLPKESVKYGGRIYPRANKPKRYAYPNYDLVPIPRRQLKQIMTEVNQEVQRTHRALDA